MQARGPQNPYEVYCFQCNVSAPVGTRRCVHCGGRLSGPQDPRRSTLAGLLEPESLAGLLEPESSEAEEDGEELATSIGSAAPKIVLWIVLLIGGFLYRYCN